MPLIAQVFPAFPNAREIEPHVATVLLYLRDPCRKETANLEAFATVFKLTRAESRLVVALAGGQSVKAYAQEMDVSEETVRWHLKNVLSKTGAGSQVELMIMAHNSTIPTFT